MKITDWIKFDDLYYHQRDLINTHYITDITENLVDPVKMYGSATAAMVEIGEMLQCDTRWKANVTGSMKPPVHNTDEFLNEFADIVIYLTNTLIYAGFQPEDLLLAIDKKLKINMKRFEEYGFKN